MLSLLVAALLPMQASGMASVATGRHSSFVVDAAGTVTATGRNNKGQLGIGSTAVTKGLTEVIFPMEAANETNETQPAPPKVVQVAVGGFHTLFLTMAGVVYAAGSNQFGQLATGDNLDSMTPVKLDFGENASHVMGVAAGYAHSLFLMHDGTVRAAGANSAGQLGDGSVMHQNTPVNVLNTAGDAQFTQADQIAAGYDFSYIRNSASEAFAVGQNLGGQLGAGSGRSHSIPMSVRTNVLAFAAGESHGLFLTNDNIVWGTGANFDGQLGDNTVQSKLRLVEIDLDPFTHTVAAGGDSSCFASHHKRELMCTGSNREGQLGLGPVQSVKKPTPVEASDRVIDHVHSIAIADHHSMILTFPQDVYAMGTNSFGELGDEAETNVPIIFTTNPLSPTPAPDPTPAPPTAPPTPAPPTTPSPPDDSTTPEGTKKPSGDGDSNTWAVWLWGGGICLGLLLLVVAIARGQGADDEDGGVAVQMSEEQDALEQMRAQMSS